MEQQGDHVVWPSGSSYLYLWLSNAKKRNKKQVLLSKVMTEYNIPHYFHPALTSSLKLPCKSDRLCIAQGHIYNLLVIHFLPHEFPTFLHFLHSSHEAPLTFKLLLQPFFLLLFKCNSWPPSPHTSCQSYDALLQTDVRWANGMAGGMCRCYLRSGDRLSGRSRCSNTLKIDWV